MKMKIVVILAGMGAVMSLQQASGFGSYETRIPNGATVAVGESVSCTKCHGPEGPPLNSFGTAFNNANRAYNSALAMLDSDGDSFSNGAEMGDPNGTWTQGQPNPGGTVYNPGNADSHPPAAGGPTVSLTEPADGATFTAPATITVSADASDSDGTVTQVEFFADTTSIGTDTSSPYSITLDNVAAGTYSLTAVATDNSGATTTSAARTITVNGGAATSQMVQKITIKFTAYVQGETDIDTGDNKITRNAQKISVSNRDIINLLGTQMGVNFSDNAELLLITPAATPDTPVPSLENRVVVRDDNVDTDVTDLFRVQIVESVEGTTTRLDPYNIKGPTYAVILLELQTDEFSFNVGGFGKMKLTAVEFEHEPIGKAHGGTFKVSGTGLQGGTSAVLNGSVKLSNHRAEAVD